MKVLIPFFLLISSLSIVIPAVAAPDFLKFRCINERGYEYINGTLEASYDSKELNILTVLEKTPEKKIEKSYTEFQLLGPVKIKLADEKIIFQDSQYSIFPLGKFVSNFSKEERSLSLLVHQNVLETGNMLTRFMLEEISGSDKKLIELYCN